MLSYNGASERYDLCLMSLIGAPDWIILAVELQPTKIHDRSRSPSPKDLNAFLLCADIPLTRIGDRRNRAGFESKHEHDIFLQSDLFAPGRKAVDERDT